MFNKYNLTTAEEELAEIIWQHAPLLSPKLVDIALDVLDWKKSTTYTILKRLCNKGIFRNESAQVTIILTKDELIARQSRRFVEDAFGGSLPGFIAAFVGGKKISQQEADAIKQLIDSHQEGLS